MIVCTCVCSEAIELADKLSTLATDKNHQAWAQYFSLYGSYCLVKALVRSKDEVAGLQLLEQVIFRLRSLVQISEQTLPQQLAQQTQSQPLLSHHHGFTISHELLLQLLADSIALQADIMGRNNKEVIDFLINFNINDVSNVDLLLTSENNSARTPRTPLMDLMSPTANVVTGLPRTTSNSSIAPSVRPSSRANSVDHTLDDMIVPQLSVSVTPSLDGNGNGDTTVIPTTNSPFGEGSSPRSPIPPPSIYFVYRTRLEQSIALFSEAEELYRQLFGDNSIRRGEVFVAMGDVCRVLNRYVRARFSLIACTNRNHRVFVVFVVSVETDWT
jgi:hypothetical protein